VKVDSSDVRDPAAVELAGEEAVAATKVEGLAAIGWDDIQDDPVVVDVDVPALIVGDHKASLPGRPARDPGSSIPAARRSRRQRLPEPHSGPPRHPGGWDALIAGRRTRA
jgi:hypothetical protein